MQIIGVARLGRDAEVRYTPDGTAVANLNMAFNYGRKDGEGKRPTQWVEGSLWGKLAEALADYLVKGQQISVTMEDPHIEEYEGRNGTGTKLVARVLSVELVGGKPEGHGQGGGQMPAGHPALFLHAQRGHRGGKADKVDLQRGKHPQARQANRPQPRRQPRHQPVERAPGFQQAHQRQPDHHYRQQHKQGQLNRRAASLENDVDQQVHSGKL